MSSKIAMERQAQDFQKEQAEANAIREMEDEEEKARYKKLLEETLICDPASPNDAMPSAREWAIPSGISVFTMSGRCSRKPAQAYQKDRHWEKNTIKPSGYYTTVKTRHRRLLYRQVPLIQK